MADKETSIVGNDLSPDAEPTFTSIKLPTIQDLDDQISILLEEIDQRRAKITILVRQRQDLQGMEMEDNSPAADTAARVAYVRDQNRIKRERAQRAGILLGGDPRCQLDQTLSHRKRRDGVRPSRPIKTGEKEE